MNNVVDFPNQDSKQIEQLAELQGVVERTRTITVIERKVAQDSENNSVEVEKETKVFVRPMPMRRWLLALGFLSKIIAHLPEGEGLDLQNETHLALWIVQLLGQVPDDILGVASLATDQPVEFYDRIDLDDGVKIILAVVEVNKDFFVQKVLPLLSEKLPAAKEAMGTFGQTP